MGKIKIHVGVKMRKLAAFPLIIMVIVACGSQNEGSDIRVDSGSHVLPQVSFKANGTEPFWGLTISDQYLSFSSLSPGLESFDLPYNPPVSGDDTSETVYSSESEAGKMQVRISSPECMNAMSGEWFEKSVTVSIQPADASEPFIFEGCGSQIPEVRPYGSWELTLLEGAKAEVDDFNERLPYITFENQGRFTGFAGCNRMFGEVDFDGSMVAFSGVGLTRMFCENNKEYLFVQALNASDAFEFEDDTLSFFRMGENVLTFQKVRP